MKDQGGQGDPPDVRGRRFRYGQAAITSRLNAADVPPPKGTNGWHHSTVGALLRDRRLIGEFQPMMVTEDGRRVPNGDPIRDYYPAIIKPGKR